MHKQTMIAMAITMGMVALGAEQIMADPVPIVVQAKVGNDAMKSVENNTPTEIAHIDLTEGNWIVSGLVNIYWEAMHPGVVWLGASIGEGRVRLVTNGTCPFSSTEIAGNRSNFMQALTIPGSLIVVPAGGERLYLVAYSLEWAPASTGRAWGSITAKKNED